MALSEASASLWSKHRPVSILSIAEAVLDSRTTIARTQRSNNEGVVCHSNAKTYHSGDDSGVTDSWAFTSEMSG